MNISERVRQCVRAGIVDNEIIAKLCGISVLKLERDFPVELGLTNEEDLIQVADVAFEMAVCGKFPHMTQYWLKVKGGEAWRETEEVKVETRAPITVVLSGSGEATVV